MAVIISRRSSYCPNFATAPSTSLEFTRHQQSLNGGGVLHLPLDPADPNP